MTCPLLQAVPMTFFSFSLNWIQVTGLGEVNTALVCTWKYFENKTENIWSTWHWRCSGSRECRNLYSGDPPCPRTSSWCWGSSDPQLYQRELPVGEQFFTIGWDIPTTHPIMIPGQAAEKKNVWLYFIFAMSQADFSAKEPRGLLWECTIFYKYRQ